MTTAGRASVAGQELSSVAKDFVDSVREYYRGLNQDPRLPCSRDMPLEEILERERARTGIDYQPVEQKKEES
jgi:hypothetical protein